MDRGTDGETSYIYELIGEEEQTGKWKEEEERERGRDEKETDRVAEGETSCHKALIGE